jgi:pSer/pThr/pTyr-binding forkhead associated (FHA) protein
MTDARYVLVLADEPDARFPLAGSVTVGRHLDNDLVIAGEDVRDFHVRIETNERGPRVFVLEGATAHVDETPIDGSAGLRPGAALVLGQHRLRLDVETSASPCGWKLHRVGDGTGIPIAPTLNVGRATDCDLQLVEGHVSRHHAQLTADRGAIWLEDLRSANGTYVNGDRVSGAWRVFHGDEISFDTLRYQLIGDAPDLTPIRPPGQVPDQLEVSERLVGEPARAETAEIPNVTVEAGALPTATPVVPDPPPTGPMLIGRSAPVTGRVFPLAFGRHLIGRGPDADIHLSEASVSLRHAELELRPDGAQLVNLISTNGTWINGAEIHTARLGNGDSIRIGRVTLQYREPTVRRSSRSRRRLLWMVSVTAVALVSIALAWTWLY